MQTVNVLIMTINTAMDDSIHRRVVRRIRRVDQVLREGDGLVWTVPKDILQHVDGQGMDFGRPQPTQHAESIDHAKCKGGQQLPLQLRGVFEGQIDDDEQSIAHLGNLPSL